MHLRGELAGGSPRAKEALREQMRATGCAYSADVQKEKACAESETGKDIAATCRAYDKRL
jgi:hypothetical protein